MERHHYGVLLSSSPFFLDLFDKEYTIYQAKFLSVLFLFEGSGAATVAVVST